MPTLVRRDGDRVWIEGVTGWSPHERVSSVHAALYAALHALGDELSYAYLVGVSGLAFRTQVSGNLCPSSPHPCCGYRCVARATEALSWELRKYEVKPDDAAQVSRARQAVIASLERGAPALYGNEEDGIVVGYQKGGAEWLCYHPLRDAGRSMVVETQWPWGVAVFAARKERPAPRRELAVGALRQALEMSNTAQSDNYFVGFRAWDEYAGRLRQLQTADERVWSEALPRSVWLYAGLAQYRSCAAEYLREIAGEFTAPAADHLRKAADAYTRVSEQLLSVEERSSWRIAPVPCMFQNEPPPDTLLREQIHRLDAALPHERAAVAELERALTLTTAAGHGE